jgi:hypothetical protein
MKSIASKISESEEIKRCDSVVGWIKKSSRSCYLALVYRKSKEFELAYFLHSLFLFKISRMYMINNRIELIVVLPLTKELKLFPRTNGFAFRWLDYKETQYEIKTKDKSIFKFLNQHIKDAALYQREAFGPGSASHQWVWKYDECIPPSVKIVSFDTQEIFNSRSTMKFLPEHYGKSIMYSYVQEQLKKRENEYVSMHAISFFIGTWNCAGTPPSQNLSKWLKGNTEEVPGYDVIVICLQEMCKLKAKNMLGDEGREECWHNFIKDQVQACFSGVRYESVYNI